MWEFWKSRAKATTPVGESLDGKRATRANPQRTVNFKDLSLRLQQQSETGDEEVPLPGRRPKAVERNKLIIIVVGLPGRGKTFLCNKLVSYLSWLAT